MALTSDPKSTERSRTFTWSDPTPIIAAAQEIDGLTLMQRLRDGELPPPPIADLVDARLVAVDRGTATFAVEPAEWMYNPLGTVHGGIAATLLDSCMGCAVQTLLPAGVGYTTTDLQVRYVRGMSSDTGRVLATATVTHPGKRVMTVEARMVTEADDKLIAHGSSACIILR